MFPLFTPKKVGTSSKKEEDKKEGIKTSDIQEFYYMISVKNLPSILEKGILSHSRIDKAKKEKELESKDISNQDVQNRREKLISYKGKKKKPSQVSLHRFANLYLNPHNAMMAVVAPKTPDLCVLRISSEILKRGDVILTSRNAATAKATFTPASSWSLSPESSSYLSRASSKTKEESQAENVDREFERLAELCKTNRKKFDEEFPGGPRKFFSEEKQKVKGAVQKARKAKQVRQAEALVRSKIAPRFITGIFVPDKDNEKEVKKILGESGRKDITITQHSSLFIGYKGNYKDLLPFKVLTSKASLKGEDDYGYPSDLSDEEETPSSSSSMSSSSSSSSS